MTTALPIKEQTGTEYVASPPFPGVESAIPSVPAIAHVLPSLTDIAFLMPLLFIFFKLDGARTLLGDGDTGWHIRTGEWILANGEVPRHDMFSFSRPGAPWFAWEWLSDLLLAMLHSRGGMGAVILASLALICLTSVLLFRLARRKCGNGLVAIGVTLLATGGCAIHWLARPHLFTLLFFVVTLHITERASQGRVRLLLWLVPLTALWVNLHGGFFVVFLVLATYVANLLIRVLIQGGEEERGRLFRMLRPWLWTGIGCFGVTFLNPYGWNLHRHLVEYLGDPYNLKYITEFQSMNFHSPVALYFEPLMIGSLFAAFWAMRQGRFQEALLALGWMQLALVAQRNIPLFALAAAPLVAQGFVALLEAGRSSQMAAWLRSVPSKMLRLASSVDEIDRIGRIHLVGALPIIVIGLLLLLPPPASSRFAVNYDPTAYPEQAIPVLLSPETHRIFAEDEWGDYLIYKLYPARRVFVDGRSDFYGDDFGMEYQKLLSVSDDCWKVLDKYSIDTIVLSPRYALTTALKFSPDWKVVYDDHVAVIFRRSQSEPLSAISSNSRNYRDRVITNRSDRDPQITQTQTKPRT